MDILFNKVGIIYNGKLDPAKSFAVELEKFVRKLGAAVWRLASYQEEEISNNIGETQMVISVGGDGTLLRSARLVSNSGTPILGINLGKLGFTTELSASEALDKIPNVLEGQSWIDTRSTLNVEVSGEQQTFQALNDVVIGRGAISRIIQIEATIDGQLLTTYRADGMIIATATGSTGYSMASGGPIMYAQSRDILLLPICPHLSFDRCLVLPSSTVMEFRVITDHQAMLSIDGQLDIALKNTSLVKVRVSDNQVKLLRLRQPTSVYGTLIQRLNGVSHC